MEQWQRSVAVCIDHVLFTLPSRDRGYLTSTKTELIVTVANAVLVEGAAVTVAYSVVLETTVE